MNRHPFRWDAIAFGLFFLAVLGQWAVWERNLLEPDELAYVAATALIVLGVLGIAGTAISARSAGRTAPFTPKAAVAEEPEDNDPTENTPTDNDNAPTHGGNHA